MKGFARDVRKPGTHEALGSDRFSCRGLWQVVNCGLSLDPVPHSQDLRPQMAENAEELLRQADEAMPTPGGPRGSRRKKRELLKLKVIRVSYVCLRFMCLSADPVVTPCRKRGP
jgi:hypothetical protein